MDISNTDMTSSPVVTAGRRKSGRAVKVPEKFIPEVSSSQVAPPNAKRKRLEEYAENDASDIEEEDEESEEEEVESAAEEEIKETRKKAKVVRKPVAKKPKVNGASSHKPAPAPIVKLPSRAKKGKKVLIADSTAEGLYAEVFTSGKHADDVAGEFLRQYSENSPAALTDLVNMVLKAAGCDIQVTEDDINDADNVEGRLGELQEEFQAQNISDYPLISKVKSSVDFRYALVGFFSALIQAMDKSGLMYEDAALIENIHIWMATMTSSTSRPFRHTSTLIALTLTSAMCSVASGELGIAAKIRQQTKTEKSKGGNKARIMQFQKNITASENKKKILSDRIKDFFDTVYVHRYRDVDPRIRVECVEGLGNWIRMLSDDFNEGQYLRYMGWMLSDTTGPMRQEVIKQLYEIMKNKDTHSKMITFIERFRSRLIEIATQDAEPPVRSAAVKLVHLIREAGMLEPDDIDIMGKLIYDSEPQVRKAVVPFFVAGVEEVYEAKVLELGGDEDLEVLAVDDDNLTAPRKEWIKLKTLAEVLSSYDTEDQDEDPSQVNRAADVEFLNVSGGETRFTLAAQALYENMADIKDWDIIASYLLFDHSAKPSGNKSLRAIKASFKPTDKEEIILLEILNAAVKLGLSRIDGSDQSKGKKSAREELSEAKESTARRLAALIPRLLKKFGAIPQTATIVLRLEHVLNLGVFRELRQDSTAYANLLDEISSQFSAHADRGVLSEAGAALLHARSYEELEELTESKIQSLWEDTTNTLQNFNKAGEITVRGAFSESTLAELSHTLARLDKLASISNCVEALEADDGQGNPIPINILLDIVARGVFEQEDPDLDALEDEVVLSAIRASMFYFMWKVHSIKGSLSAGELIPEIDIEHLNNSQDIFITNLISSLSSRATLDPIRLFATGTLLDLHVLFATFRAAKKAKGATNGADENEHLQSLVKDIVPEVQTELTSIFDLAEKQFAKKSRKKLAEPGEDEEPEDPESEPEDEEDEDATESERKSEILKAEHQLCELAGKLVLAILAKVIDVSPPLQGKLTARIQRNRTRLGPSYRDVIAYLDESKSKAKKSHKSKAKQAAEAAKKAEKSKEVVEEEDEEEDPFANPEPEEGTAEDLRRRELVDGDVPMSEGDEGAADAEAEDEDNDMLGD